MAFEALQLPNWTQINSLFSPAQMQIQQNQAAASNYAPQIAQNQADAGSQTLADRSTLRGLAGLLATGDPNAIATAATLPDANGPQTVSTLGNFNTQRIGSGIQLGQAWGSLPHGMGVPNAPWLGQPTQQGVPPALGGINGLLSPSAVDGAINSIGSAEGGSNPGVVNKQGYNGQFQFGAPRLQDLGVYQPAAGEIGQGGAWNGQTQGTFNIPGFPQVKTQADFLANPDAQRAVMHLQVNNLMQTAAATPGAQNFDPVGLLAVGHLGGPQGMVNFIKSGGQYNPADANGTTLQSYYQRFAGNPGALQAAAGHPMGPLPADHPALQQPAYQVASAQPQTMTDAAPGGMPTTPDTNGAGPLPVEEMPGAPSPDAPVSAAPAQQPGTPAAPGAQPWQPQVPPGYQLMRNNLGFPLPAGSPGFGLAVNPQTGQRMPVRITPPTLNFTNVAGTLVGSDPNSGSVVSREKIQETGKTTMVNTPQGVVPYINGHPVGDAVPYAANTAQVATQLYKEDREDLAKTADDMISTQANMAKNLEQRALLATGVPTGAGGDARAKWSNIAETYLPPALAKQFENSLNLPDAAPAQEYAKLSLQNAGTQERETLGGRGGFRAIELYKSANPSLELQPTANRDIHNLQLVAQQADLDYGNGLHDWVTQNGQSLMSGGAYHPASEFDRDWLKQNNPRVYAAAASAMNGKPFATWSNGLSQDEATRALQIAGRVDPTTVVQGRKGQLPVSQFMQQQGQ